MVKEIGAKDQGNKCEDYGFVQRTKNIDCYVIRPWLRRSWVKKAQLVTLKMFQDEELDSQETVIDLSMYLR